MMTQKVGKDPFRLALQTWSVRRPLVKDPRKTLADVRAVGFKYLEVANTGSRPPKEFSELCREYGLAIMGTHEPPLTSGNLRDLINEIKVRCGFLKPRFVTVMLHPDDLGHTASYLHYATLCSEVGRALRREGIILCYHCYDYDLVSLGPARESKSGFDILLEQTLPEDLSFELDTYFIVRSGADFGTVLRKCGSRCKLVHLCDINKEGARAAIGKGVIDWDSLIETLQVYCAPEWFIIEDDVRSSLKSIKSSLTYCRLCFTKKGNS